MARKSFSRLGVMLTAAALVVSLAGCGSSGTDGSASATASPTVSDAASGGDDARTDLNIRIPDSFSTLDPQNWTLDSDNRLCQQIYEPLYRLDDSGTEIPVLATAYTIADDGLSVTFTLRDGVSFTNGEALTASDVKFSIERTQKSAYLMSNLTTVSGVEADDAAGTVTVLLSAPTPAIIQNLSYVLVVNQKFVEENQDENGLLGFNACGTGPYMLDNYALDDHITLVSNPDYRDGEAAIKTLNFYLITDENTAVTALQAGELDVARLSTSNWDAIKADDAFQTTELSSNHVSYLILNTKQAPFDNELVRQAIACAINRDDIISMAMDGRAAATYTVATPFMIGYAEIDPQFTYDPDRAKDLLAQAGYPDGLDIGEALTLSGSYFADVMEVVQQQLAAVGITCTVTGLEANTLISQCMTGSFGLSILGQTNNFDMSWISTYYGTENIGSMNMAQYSDADVDAQLQEAAVCMDPEARIALYKSILETVDTACPYVPLFNRLQCMAWSSDLNFTPQLRGDYFYACSWN